jgi:hypothetical protein
LLDFVDSSVADFQESRIVTALAYALCLKMPRLLLKTGTGATSGVPDKTPHSPPTYSRKRQSQSQS